jgi:hypothetical protein
MRRRDGLLLLLLALGGAAGLPAWAEEKAALDAGALKAAGIQLDAKKREVRVEATACLDRGVLEYVVCLPGTFEHEAVFCARCKPSVLHLALLAIGLEPYAFEADDDWWAKAREQPRSRVRIEVEYDQEGKTLRRPISQFLVNRELKDGVVPDAWVFTGSFFGRRDGKRIYAADLAGGVIGLCSEQASVLQFGEKIGNPYHGEELGLELNAGTALAKGTKVCLIFTPHQEKEHQSATPGKDGAQAVTAVGHSAGAEEGSSR